MREVIGSVPRFLHSIQSNACLISKGRQTMMVCRPLVFQKRLPK
jgi:hypothetical protein